VVGDWGLTYDDGPTEFSATLYDYLDSIHQKATLFYIGSNLMQFPTDAIRACGDGHQIAVHTWSHNPSTTLTNEQFVAEVKYTELAIQELCNVTPRYFRPPYGDIDNRIRNLLDQMGYISVIWDLDTNDWQIGSGQTTQGVDLLFSQWEAARPNDTAGHICLEHELTNASVSEAIKNLPQLGKTFNLMPVAACLGDPHPYRENICMNTRNSTCGSSSPPLSTASSSMGSPVTTMTTHSRSTTAAGLQSQTTGKIIGSNSSPSMRPYSLTHLLAAVLPVVMVFGLFSVL